jgi:hypothetical protein
MPVVKPRVISALAVATVLAAAAAGACVGELPPIQVPEIEADIALPMAEDSLRFAVIGDAGTGGRQQYDVAAMMAAYHRRFPFDFVLMLGDNLYGAESPDDYRRKFEVPYAPLLDAGVDFYASLGNHDDRSQRLYELFNMNDQLFYSFAPDGHDVRFFALYSDYLDPVQLRWLEAELAGSDESWKICFFHHPLYSSGGRHGPDLELRRALEPLFIEYGVDVVFAGHEHFYERIRPQNGITHFISGAGGKLRRGDVRADPQTAAKFDDDGSFMLVEIAGLTMFFQAVGRDGQTVDIGDLPEANAANGRNP